MEPEGSGEWVGYYESGAGPNQDLRNPLGVRGPELMEWFVHTRTWRRMRGQDDGETGTR